MCYSIIRTVCKACGNQVGNPEIKEAACFPAKSRPAWGSAVATLQQHRVKRFKKTISQCNDCVAAAGQVSESQE